MILVLLFYSCAAYFILNKIFYIVQNRKNKTLETQKEAKYNMNTEIMVFLAYGLGIFIIFFFGKLLLLPVKMIGKLIANSLLGAGLIALINIVGSGFGIGIPLNVINAIITGVLGVPGAVMLLVILN